MADNYEPELGQALFGQMPQELACPADVESAMNALHAAFYVVNPGRDNPFDNSGARYSWPSFKVHAYSWSDDNQEWNFKFRDFKVSWYKYIGRGMSMSRDISPVELCFMFRLCMGEMLTEKPVDHVA